MSHTEQMNIRLVVDDEQELYTSFSPEDELDGSVKAYLRSKISANKYNSNLRLTVIPRKPMDEEKFRRAVSYWIKDEKESFSIEEKSTVRMLIGLLIFGSIMILACLSLQKTIDVLQYSLMPILGSLSLSRAASILIIDMPTIRAKRWILGSMEKHNVITFEYDQSFTMAIALFMHLPVYLYFGFLQRK